MCMLSDGHCQHRDALSSCTIQTEKLLELANGSSLGALQSSARSGVQSGGAAVPVLRMLSMC